MRTLPVFVAIAIAAFAGHGVAEALCSAPRIISTAYPRGSQSYIYTPGVEPGPMTSSVTPGLEAFFWALGSGHPMHGQGNDSGTFVALDEAGGGWVQRPLGYPATFHTTWAARREIDGCVEAQGAATHRCSAVLLTDQQEDHSYFAILTSRPTNGNYSFAQPDDASIALSEIPSPTILQVTGTAAGLLSVVLRVDGPSEGIYLDSACPAGVVVGYRVYEHRVPDGEAAPSDLRRRPLEGATIWELSTGGETITGDPIALGAPVAISSDCDPGEDLYLAASLVFDSGFESAHVSRVSSAIECAE